MNLSNIGSHNCSTCFRCCTTPNVKDVLRTPKMDSDFENNYVTPIYNQDIDNIHEKCIGCQYLQGNGRCSVYERRPIICRTWPLFPVEIEGVIKLGVAAYKCGYGKDVVDGVMSGDEELINELKEKLEWIKTQFTIDEIRKQTWDTLHKYRVFITLNL